MRLARTQVYLEKYQHEALKQEAKAGSISLAELFRGIVKEHLSGGKKAAKLNKDMYMSIVGIGISGEADTSVNHDAHMGKAVANGHSR